MCTPNTFGSRDSPFFLLKRSIDGKSKENSLRNPLLLILSVAVLFVMIVLGCNSNA